MSETTSKHFGGLALAFAAVVVVLDQASKYWIVEGLGLTTHQSLPLLGPLRATLVWNPGVSFGIFNDNPELARWPLTIFGFGMAAALAWWARKADRRLTAVALACIMGGAVGNAIDRIRYGSVVDFIDVGAALPFPWVFNIADAAINIGVGLLILDALRRERTPG